jgi:hypothetical protein
MSEYLRANLQLVRDLVAVHVDDDNVIDIGGIRGQNHHA